MCVCGGGGGRLQGVVTQIDPVVTTATAIGQGQRLAKAAQKVSKRGQKYSRLTHSARVEYYLADWICTHFLVRIGQKKIESTFYTNL